jgi:hypothetical protein
MRFYPKSKYGIGIEKNINLESCQMAELLLHIRDNISKQVLCIVATRH